MSSAFANAAPGPLQYAIIQESTRSIARAALIDSICAAHGDEDAHVSLVDSRYSLDSDVDHFTLDGARHHEHYYRFPSRFPSRPYAYFYVSSFEESWPEDSLLGASDFSDEPSGLSTPTSPDFSDEPPRSSTPISSEEPSPAWPEPSYIMEDEYGYTNILGQPNELSTSSFNFTAVYGYPREVAPAYVFESGLDQLSCGLYIDTKSITSDDDVSLPLILS